MVVKNQLNSPSLLLFYTFFFVVLISCPVIKYVKEKPSAVTLGLYKLAWVD